MGAMLAVGACAACCHFCLPLPPADGQVVVTGSADTTLMVWDASTSFGRGEPATVPRLPVSVQTTVPSCTAGQFQPLHTDKPLARRL